MPNRGEFRATTDQLMKLVDELRHLEELKRAQPVGSEQFVNAARAAAVQSRLIFRWCEMQDLMAQEAAARRARGEETEEVRLIDVQARPLDRILANWREAQIRLEIAVPGSPEAEAAADDIERLREEYQVGHGARMDGASGMPTMPGLLELQPPSDLPT